MDMVWVFGALALLFLLQLTRVFSLFGVAPNLSLVLLLILGARRTPLLVFVPALLWFLVLGSFWAPFWMVEAGAAVGIALVGYVLAPLLPTGNRWIDVALLAAAGTFCYAAVGRLAWFAPFTWRVPAEAVYNILVGLLLLAVLARWKAKFIR